MQTPQHKKRIWQVLAFILLAVMVVIYLSPLLGFRALNVKTASMVPAVRPGDLLIEHTVAPSAIKVGQIVTYKSLTTAGQTISHRVVRLETMNGGAYVVTKGDANKVADPPVAVSDVTGRVLAIVPALGFLQDVVTSNLGLLLLVVIPGVVVIWGELGRIKTALHDRQPNAPVRRIDGLYRSVAVIVAVIIMAAASAAVMAASSSPVNLAAIVAPTNAPSSQPTSQSTAKPNASPDPTPSPAPTPCPSNISVSSTSPNSNISVNCSGGSDGSGGSTSVSVDNQSSQTANSGSVDVDGNAQAGSPNSVSNNSSSSTNVTITN